MDRHHYLIVAIICLIITIICGLFLFQAYAAESGSSPPVDPERGQLYVTSDDSLAIKPPKSTHRMVFTPDGQVLLNGIPIEKLDTPEIRKILVEILKEMRKQSKDTESMSHYCGRQTDYLLQEIGKCREELGAIKKK